MEILQRKSTARISLVSDHSLIQRDIVRVRREGCLLGILAGMEASQAADVIHNRMYGEGALPPPPSFPCTNQEGNSVSFGTLLLLKIGSAKLLIQLIIR